MHSERTVKVRVACCVTESGWSIAAGGDVDQDGTMGGYTDPERFLRDWEMLDGMPDERARVCWVDAVVPKPDPDLVIRAEEARG